MTHKDRSDHSRAVCVKTYLTRYEAEMAQGILESGDIASFISADDAGGTGIIIPKAGVRLMVAEQDLRAAQDLLAPDDDDKLPPCSSTG